MNENLIARGAEIKKFTLIKAEISKKIITNG